MSGRADEETKLEDRIDRTTDDPAEKTPADQPAQACSRASAIFDQPRRDYNALQFTLTRRFSKKLYVQGSYTLLAHRG